MNRTVFICPVCGRPLSCNGNTYSCPENHSYDIAKEGYINLLLANRKNSREPGDSKEMLGARKSFLNRGYYKPLARSVASLIIKYINRSDTGMKLTYCQRHPTSPGPSPCCADRSDDDVKPEFIILDAGCGEGYYTDYISKNRYIKKSSMIYGIDISKEGIRYASKRNGTVNYAVAGIYSLPLPDCSADLILNIFAPFDEDEFGRVIKDNGIILSVTPGATHLYTFKKNLYDEVYLNDEKFELSARFDIAETLRVKYELNIHNRDDIAGLLKMTPYYHKSSPDRIESFLKTAERIRTEADFVIRVIRKKSCHDLKI